MILIDNNTVSLRDPRALEMMYVVFVTVIIDPVKQLYQSPCTGTLLQKDLVLTTINCIVDEHGHEPDATKIKIYLRTLEEVRGQYVFKFPNQAQKFDVAIIMCDDTGVQRFPGLPHSPFKIQPVCMVGGYGSKTKPVTHGSFQLNTINRSEVWNCNQYSLWKDRLCLHLVKVIPCRGDIGAPLVCGGILHGIYNPHTIPKNPNCVKLYGTEFTPLYPLIKWIADTQDSANMSYLTVLNNPFVVVAVSTALLAIIASIYYTIIYFIERRVSCSE